MFRDLRFGVRQLRRRPVFTITAVLTLALGIGANTAVFGVLDALMLRELPVEKPEELLRVVPRSPHGDDSGFSQDLFTEFSRVQQAFSALYAASQPDSVECVTSEGAIRSSLQLISGDYFATLGVRPLMGRLINAEDDRAAVGQPVVVVSHRFWTRAFAGSPSILGKVVKINNQFLTIVGVANPEFRGDMVGEYPDLWIPVKMQSQVQRGLNVVEGSNAYFLHVVGRPTHGQQAKQLQARLAAALESIRLNSALASKRNVREMTGFETAYAGRGISKLREQLTQPLTILVGIAGLLLLLACANLANLLLARAAARQRELSVRIAVGASHGQILRQLIVESLLLGSLGGLSGLLTGLWGTSLLAALLVPGGSADALALDLNVRTLGFTFAASLLTVLLFGLGPAVHMTRGSIASALRMATGQNRSQFRITGVLVAGQVAISFVLLLEAGLFLGTLKNLGKQETGFAREGVLQIGLDTAAAGYTTEQLAGLYRRISDEMLTLPRVQASGFAFLDAVGGGSTEFCCVAVQNAASPAPQNGNVSFNVVTPGYFEAAGMKLLAGRSLDASDLADKRVAILNQTMARRFFGNGNPIGARLALGDPPKPPFDVEVIGVVNDARHSNLREENLPMLYLSRQPGFRFHLRFLYVRAAGDPSWISRAVTARLRAIDPHLPIHHSETIAQIMDRELARERVITRLASAFGMLALALTAIGLYGVLSYTVARRTSEIAVRIALGATPGRLLWLVLRSTSILLAAGLAAGVATAFGLARVVQALLYGLTPTDPFMIVVTCLVLVATALAAAFAPVRRALSVPASIAFRQE